MPARAREGSVSDWLSLDCRVCGQHLGFMGYCGPTGTAYCDACKEMEDTAEEEARQQREEDGASDA